MAGEPPSWRTLVAILTIINLIVWLDRGILAGAATHLKGCVSDPLECAPRHLLPQRGCDPDSTEEARRCASGCLVCWGICEGEIVTQTGFGIGDFKLGLIQATFMMGYMGGSLIFSRFAGRGAGVYSIAFAGLMIWMIGVFVSGWSGLMFQGHPLGVWMLGAGRALSGVGEASLACVALPHLEDVAPAPYKGRVLALYFSAIPLGTAMGFVWAGGISEIWRWEYAFWLEIPLALPFVLWCGLRAPHLPLRRGLHRGVSRVTRRGLAAPAVESAESSESLSLNLPVETASSDENFVLISPGPDPETFDLTRAAWDCLASPEWVAASLGLAAFTYCTAGLAFYMPMFLQTYKPCEQGWVFSQAKADAVFGLIVSTAGFVGSIGGGVAYDFVVEKRGPATASKALRLATGELALGTLVLALGIFAEDSRVFFLVGWLGVVCAFATQTPVNASLLDVVPERSRSVSMALSLIAAHFFGDVPAPALIGRASDERGPKAALALAWLGLPVAVGLWGLAAYFAKRDRV